MNGTFTSQSQEILPYKQKHFSNNANQTFYLLNNSSHVTRFKWHKNADHFLIEMSSCDWKGREVRTDPLSIFNWVGRFCTELKSKSSSLIEKENVKLLETEFRWRNIRGQNNLTYSMVSQWFIMQFYVEVS